MAASGSKAMSGGIAAVTRLSIAQFLLMILVATVFIRSDAFSRWTFETTHFFLDYIPILWRYHLVFKHSNQLAEFYKVFSIYLSNIAIQCGFLSMLIYRISKDIDFKDSFKLLPLQKTWLALVLLMFLHLMVEITIGQYNLNQTAFYSNRVANGDYFSGIFSFCFLIPFANFVLYSSIYATHEGSIKKSDSKYRAYTGNTNPP